MKTPLLLSLALLIGTFPANAGNMFGPAPFRNGSPLVTGVDGTYQATARAENVTGIFRFAYSGGSQTVNANQNNWVFFVNGQVLRGTVDAALNQSSLTGILDGGSSSLNRDSDGQIILPVYFFSGANSASGSFNGKLDLMSPSGAFSGKGELLPTPSSTNEITAIYRNSVTGGNFTFLGDFTSTNISYTNSGGTIAPFSFRFRGVRTSTSTSPNNTNSITPET